MFNDSFIANFMLSVTVKESWKSVNILRRYGQEFGVVFWATVYYRLSAQCLQLDRCRILWLYCIVRYFCVKTAVRFRRWCERKTVLYGCNRVAIGIFGGIICGSATASCTSSTAPTRLDYRWRSPSFGSCCATAVWSGADLAFPCWSLPTNPIRRLRPTTTVALPTRCALAVARRSDRATWSLAARWPVTD